MAFPTYGTLLQANNPGKPEPAVIRSEFESGPARQYKTKSRTAVMRPLSIVYTDTELGSFETWFRGSECDWGVNWFDWEDYRDGTTKQARIYQGDYQYHHIDAGEGAPLKYQVDLTLELLEG